LFVDFDFGEVFSFKHNKHNDLPDSIVAYDTQPGKKVQGFPVAASILWNSLPLDILSP